MDGKRETQGEGKKMNVRYFILTLIFSPILFYLGVKNYEVWYQMDQPSASVKKEDKRKIEKIAQEISPEEMKPLPLEALIGISEKNIFHPERKEFPMPLSSPSGKGEVKKPIVRPQVILHGIVYREDYQSALVVQVGRKLLPGERETMRVKIGDKLGDYKISKIFPDRILLESDEDSFEVLLYDPKLPKKRAVVRTEVKPSTVTSAIPSPEPPKPASSQPVGSTVEKPREVPTQVPREGVVQSPLPTPLTPSSTPTRRRTWFGPKAPQSD
jgi:hypothetical protein